MKGDMETPRSTLFLPSGTLAEMRLFRRWLGEQPTYRVVPASAGESCDIVEFNTCLCSCYLIRSLEKMLPAHTPYHLFLNLPVPERKTGALYVHATERGVMARGQEWRPIAPITAEQWADSVARATRRGFALRALLWPDGLPDPKS
jgi:hypothetical protein